MSGDFILESLKNRVGFIRSRKFAKKLPDKRFRKTQADFRKSLELDCLENRELLAVDVVVGDLLFRGDLVQYASVYRATAKPVQVGYNPVFGEEFRPLVTLSGNVNLDTSADQFQFKGTGLFDGKDGQIPFWQNDILATYSIKSLEDSGITIKGVAFSFGDLKTTAQTLQLSNPNGGITTDANIKLGGSGQFGFGTDENGTAADSPVDLSSYILTITGPDSGSASGLATGMIYVAGTHWNFNDSPMVSTIRGGMTTTSLTTVDSATIRGDQMAVTMQNSGLVISRDEIASLDATISGVTHFAGYDSTITGTLAYTTDVLTFSGSGTLGIGGLTDDSTLENLTFSVGANKLTSLDSSQLVLGRLGFAELLNLKALRALAFDFDLKCDLSLDPDTGDESVKITGSMLANKIRITLPNDGIVLKNGQISDWQFQLDGELELAGIGLEFQDFTIFHISDSHSYGGFGTFSFAIDGFKESKNPADKTKRSEPVNLFSFQAGASISEPGLLFVDGELRRVDANISTESGPKSLNLGGYTFKINQLGLVYTADAGAVTQDWGVYGNISLNTRKATLDNGKAAKDISGNLLNVPISYGSDQRMDARINLGDRENPGLLIQKKYDADRGRNITDWSLNSSEFRLTGLYLGPLRISELDVIFSYNSTDGLVLDHFALTMSWNGFMLGGSITFKDVTDPATGVIDRAVDAFTVTAGLDPGVNKATTGVKSQGLPILPPYISLMYMVGGVSNLTDPDNLIINVQATFIVGKSLPVGWTGVKDTTVYTGIVVGNVTIDLAKNKISGSVNAYLGAYWDATNYAAKQNPWKPLLGSGTGTFLIDWGNNNYELDISANLIQLVSARMQIKINSSGFVAYAMVQIKPTPYGIFDFWPINEIDVSGHFLLLKSDSQFVAGAWAKVDLLFVDATVGVSYNILTNDISMIGEDEANALLKAKDAFINDTSTTNGMPYSVPVPLNLNENSVNAQAAYLRVSIPFVTTELYAYQNFAGLSELKDGDISIAIPDLIAANGSFNWHIDWSKSYLQYGFQPVDGSSRSVYYTSGNIIIDLYANKNQAMDYGKIFEEPNLSDLKINVISKTQSLFMNIGDKNREADYLNQLKAGLLSGSLYQKNNSSLLDFTQQVVIDGKSFPIFPAAVVTPKIAPPVLILENNNLISSSLNSYTNTTAFATIPNNSSFTKQNGALSLLVVDADQALANRWLVMQTGPWTATPSGSGVMDPWVADGEVVEKNSFNTFELKNRKADTKFQGGNESVFHDVLFLDNSGTVQTGWIYEQGPNTVTIKTEAGQTLQIDRNLVKLLWIEKARVKLSNANRPPRADFQIFTASNIPTGYAEPNASGGMSYYELFSTRSEVGSFGVLPAESSDNLSPNSIILPTLPHFVTDKMKFASVNDQFYPIDDSTGFKTMPAGLQTQLLGFNSTAYSASDYRSTVIPFTEINNFWSQQSITWSESSLTPTPKFAYLLVDDGINSPVYSALYKFTPSVAMQGRVMFDQGDGTQKPLSGQTVYFDTNGNSQYDEAEPYADVNEDGVFDTGDTFCDFNNNGVRDTYQEKSTVTNDLGYYYFYDVNQGSYTLGLVVPNNKISRSGSDTLQIFHGSEGLTTAPDFVVGNLYPSISGRVVVDMNHNAVADNGEKGLGNVWVVVRGANGAVLKHLTDSDGNYQIQIDNPAFGSTVNLSVESIGLDSNVSVSTTDPNAAIQQISGLDYTNPKVLSKDIIAQSNYDFHYDSSLGIFQNITNYFQAFLDGSYTGVSFNTDSFEFDVDRFKLLPFSIDQQGLESASGRLIVAGQTVYFSLNGPYGLVSKGLKLQSLNLSLSGDLTIFGAHLKLDGLTVKYTAADKIAGTSARFSISGNTTLNIDGNIVKASLPDEGLVLSDGGIESLNLKLMGDLKIGGQTLNLGSLAAIYSKETNLLTLTGSSSLKISGSNIDENYIGLDNVVLQIGLANETARRARVLGLSANLLAGFKLAGISFDASRLAFAWLPESDNFSISGTSIMTDDWGLVELNAELPGQGICISSEGILIDAKVNGTVKIGTTGFSAVVSNSGLTYADNQLKLSIYGSLATSVGGDGGTPLASELVAISGWSVWAGGKLVAIHASASGNMKLAGAVLTIKDMIAGYDATSGVVTLDGKSDIALVDAGGSVDDQNPISINGRLDLAAQKVRAISASVTVGSLTIGGGTLDLKSMRLFYDLVESKLGFSGLASLDIAGTTLTASFPSPGIIWHDGALESVSFGLSGSIPLQTKTLSNGTIRVTSEITGDLSAAFLPDKGRLSISGLAGVKFGSNLVQLAIPASPGIVIENNRLQSFTVATDFNLNFGGESFNDANGNGKLDSKENYTDANGNNQYDSGYGLSVTGATLAYQAAGPNGNTVISVIGKTLLDFDGSANGNNFVQIDVASPGIQIVDGQLANFNATLATGLELGGTEFSTTAAGSAGLQYDQSNALIAVYGTLTANIDKSSIGLAFGTSLNDPGIRLERGLVTYASAAVTTQFRVGELQFKADDAGFIYSGSDASWGIFGKVSVSNVFSASVSLGTRATPGVVIQKNNWNFNALTLTLADINLGEFELNDAQLVISRTAQSWSVMASCGVILPFAAAGSVGVAGAFSLINGRVDMISVTLASAMGVPIPNTPLSINYISGTIRNLSNPSQLTLTGSIGVGVGTSVQIFDKTASVAQFVGSFTLDSNSLKIQVDAYLGALNKGTLIQPQWAGLLATGTGIVLLDWSHGQYYADLDLTFLTGVFTTTGRLSFSSADGLILRSKAALGIPANVPLIGGITIASADFLFDYNPAKNVFFALGWGDFALLGKYGLKYDVISKKFDVLNNNEINAQLGSLKLQSAAISSQSIVPLQQNAAETISAKALFEPLTTSFESDRMMKFKGYSRTRFRGSSTPVPDTDVSDGLYEVQFRVINPARWNDVASWQKRLRLLVDPIPGVKIEQLPLEFDRSTGIGKISIKIMPLDGQYLPRGLTFKSRLISPVLLAGLGNDRAPSIQSYWAQAYSFGGITPLVGSDKAGNPAVPGLAIKDGRFTVSFIPVPDANGQLPADWLSSLRVYLNPVDGIKFDVQQPSFNEQTGVGSIEIVASRVDGANLDLGLDFTFEVRSKIQLASPNDASIRFPLLGIRWNGAPSAIDTPDIHLSDDGHISHGMQTTHLSGHVNDLRVKQVKVSFCYSTNSNGDGEYLINLADNQGPADSIPVDVNPDGSWTLDLNWDSSTLPSGDFWLYALVDESTTSIPVYSKFAGQFRVDHDITGRVNLIGSQTGKPETQVSTGYFGMPVFADLNGDGIWQSDEPRTVTDAMGDFALDTSLSNSQFVLRYEIPDYLALVAGHLSSQPIDLSHGPVYTKLDVKPIQQIVRGSVFVTGDIHVDGYHDSLGQPVSGLSVVLSGPGGVILRGTTNNDGQYELPISVPGEYSLTLDLANEEFLGFKLAEAPNQPTTIKINIPDQGSAIITPAPMRVESIGVVSETGEDGTGSLKNLIDMSNRGYISVINFDEKLRGTTIELDLPTETDLEPYYIWDQTTEEWTLVTPEEPDNADDGYSAFDLSEDLVIDGGDLGITLREGGTETNTLFSGFRAFNVLPGVEFHLRGLTIKGFSAIGNPGNNSLSGATGQAAAGKGFAGLGGAILNRGRVTLDHVTFVDNSAVGGKGGNLDLPVYQVRPLDSLPGSNTPASQNKTEQKQLTPVILNYTIGSDPTVQQTKVWISQAGAGGEGLGGAVYNGPGASLIITGGAIFSGNHAIGGSAGQQPSYLTNLANLLFGDSARTVSVTGLNLINRKIPVRGSGLGGAVFNDGGSVLIDNSTFVNNQSIDAGAAYNSRGGLTHINNSTFLRNTSPLDQGIRVSANGDAKTQFEMNHTTIFAKAGGPRALFLRGIRSTGIGNTVSRSNSQFATLPRLAAKRLSLINQPK